MKDARAIAEEQDFGAEFSQCRKYRYALWRIWDRTKPLVMFIGLNPSTANEVDSDPTIRSVGRIAKANGFGGFYMMNCFPYVSTDPNELRDHGNTAENDQWLRKVFAMGAHWVVFAWGAFPVVRELGRDRELAAMFPDAMALHMNKNGTPKHPLYCKSDTAFVPYDPPQGRRRKPRRTPKPPHCFDPQQGVIHRTDEQDERGH